MACGNGSCSRGDNCHPLLCWVVVVVVLGGLMASLISLVIISAKHDGASQLTNNATSVIVTNPLAENPLTNGYEK